MNEQTPEDQTSAHGKLSPPPWPSFGARPADSVAEDTYLSDTNLSDTDADVRDPAQDHAADVRDPAQDDAPDTQDHAADVRDPAQNDAPDTQDRAKDHAADVRDHAADDDQDEEDADLEVGGPDDVVILPADVTSGADGGPDPVASPGATGSHAGPDDLVILPDSATSRTHAGTDDGVAPASAMIRPAGDPDAVLPPASASSMSVTEQVPDRATTTAASSPSGRRDSADLEPGPAAGSQPARAGGLAARNERWRSIQSSFVDDPRSSVAAAADLAAEVVGELVASAQERERALRGEWDRDGVDTEDLRNALRSYRSFLERLPAL
jgi:hypothetical protein